MPPHEPRGAAQPVLAVVGLGSNLGDRRATIEAAMEAIARLPEVELVARSSLWRTDPAGRPRATDLYNSAVAIRCGMPLGRLMGELLAIEGRFGRVRGERNAPRTLDLDLLWVEGIHVRLAEPAGPELEVPHPRLRER